MMVASGPQPCGPAYVTYSSGRYKTRDLQRASIGNATPPALSSNRSAAIVFIVLAKNGKLLYLLKSQGKRIKVYPHFSALLCTVSLCRVLFTALINFLSEQTKWP